jgi:hypothetical protein
MLLLQFARGAVINIVPEVFLVSQNLVNRSAGPRALKVGQNSPLIVLTTS